MELFHNDFEDCLEHTLLHEYLSKNWDKVDDLIRVNEQYKKKKEKQKLNTKNGDTNNCSSSSSSSTLTKGGRRISSSRIINDNKFKNQAKLIGGSTRNDWDQTRKFYFRRSSNRRNLSLSSSSSITSSTSTIPSSSSLLRTFQREDNSFVDYTRNSNHESNNNNTNTSNKMKESFDNLFLFDRCREKHRPTVYFLGGGMGEQQLIFTFFISWFYYLMPYIIVNSHRIVLVMLSFRTGAGKSTVVTYLKSINDKMFQNDPIIVEADALKHADPIFQALRLLYNQTNAEYEQIMSSKAPTTTNPNRSGSTDPSSSEEMGEEEKEEVEEKLKRSNGKANNDVLTRMIHEHSTDAANQQLVVALANQKDIVVDGTMTWLPYVQQTIEMVRDAHKHRYLLGPGYTKNKKKSKLKSSTRNTTNTSNSTKDNNDEHIDENGNGDNNNKNNEHDDNDDDDDDVTEQYWIRAEPMVKDDRLLLPYKVEMVGVTVDPEHAVSRGIRRAIVTGRGVPIKGQLRSHRLYSENFPLYASSGDDAMTDNSKRYKNKKNKCLFDRIRLFDNSVVDAASTSTVATGGQQQQQKTMARVNGDSQNNDDTSQRRRRDRPPPRCIAWKESQDQSLSVIPAYEKFLKLKYVNDNATGVADLYKKNNDIDDHNDNYNDDNKTFTNTSSSSNEQADNGKNIIVIQAKLRQALSQLGPI